MPDGSNASSTASRTADIRREAVPGDQGQVTAAVVTIKRSPQELYDFWRDFGNLAQVMENVAEITVADPTRSHWRVKAPGGRVVEWDALVTEDTPGQVIGWRSADGADVSSSGRVEFHAAGERGTVVRAVIGYDVPGGVAGQLLAKLFQREPAIQARRDLRRFKQFMETGEVATSARTRAHAAEHKAG